MVTKIDRSFDDNFAKAWYNKGGDFSYMLSKNIIAYLKKNNLRPRNVLDIYCGAGNFLAEMQLAGLDCYGTEGSKAFIRFNEERYHDMKFYYTENMADFGTNEKFDMITCIYDLVNYLEIFSDWQELFNAASKSLNEGGIFTFDFNTQKRIADWNSIKYEQGQDMDYIETIKSGVHDKTVITYVYYVKDGSRYAKTSTIYTETSFEVARVVDALKKAGFTNITLCNFALNEVADPESMNKVHVIARK